MSFNLLSSLKKNWYKWKSLRFPWRKSFLVGLDLHGNTFWEFRDSFYSHQNRMRRIVKYKQSIHNSDVQISPQWHQWLRHTRADPPSLNELSQDILRQEQLKILAAAVDARWASESKLLDRPSRQQAQLSISSENRDCYRDPLPCPDVATCNSRDSTSNLTNLSGSNKYEAADLGSIPSSKSSDSTTETTFSEDPWKKFPGHGLPKDEWQPKSWDPVVVDCNHKSKNSLDEPNSL